MKRWLLGCAFALALAGAAAGQGTSTSNPQWADSPYTRSAPLTVGTPVSPTFGSGAFTTPVRGVMIACTVSGNITLELQDGSTVTLSALPAGIYIFPLQVIEVTTSTATAQFWVLG